MADESSISIINKNNGTLTGEKAQALPIQLVGYNQKKKWFAIGFITCAVIVLAVVYFSKRGVAIVNLDQRATEFVEYSI
jgi:hypothetical protein